MRTASERRGLREQASIEQRCDEVGLGFSLDDDRTGDEVVAGP